MGLEKARGLGLELEKSRERRIWGKVWFALWKEEGRKEEERKKEGLE